MRLLERICKDLRDFGRGFVQGLVQDFRRGFARICKDS